MAQTVGLHKLACRGPGDLAQAQRLIADGVLDPREIVAVIGKTEGNGCVNDFTREFATQAWCALLAGPLGCAPHEVHARVAFVMSGGTEGVLSPHFTVITRRAGGAAGPGEKRLAVGVAFTRDFLPEEIGRGVQVTETARAVARALHDAGISDPADVHFVQVKCPLLTAAKMADAAGRGSEPVTRDTYESMGASRGASALGVAVALGEVDAGAVSDDSIGRDGALFSRVASASAGIELDHNVVIVLGMSEQAAGPWVIDHGVMRDAIDAAPVRECLRRLGLDPDRDAAAIAERVLNVFAKSEAAPDGTVRDARHTMLNDSDIHSTRHARAAVGAVLASVVGQTALYVSGGAEHQGPPGGGPFAIVARAAQPRGT
ncbi:MAG TPA: ring-opening amidohydrolase [Burkholderiaceae bacterium]|jgi:cyanuric acid amidohydrolase